MFVHVKNRYARNTGSNPMPPWSRTGQERAGKIPGTPFMEVLHREVKTMESYGGSVFIAV
jgi:hypothetical protein